MIFGVRFLEDLRRQIRYHLKKDNFVESNEAVEVRYVSIIKIVFTKTEMNNEWNLDFLQNSLLSVQRVFHCS